MIEITSDEILTHMISVDLQKALKKLVEAIVEIVRGYVQSEVYDAYNPIKYERMHDLYGEGGFYESWSSSEIESVGGNTGGGRTFLSKIFSDPDLMFYIPEDFVHGSFEGEGDRRENLDKYIAEGVAASYDFVVSPDVDDYAAPRDYWSPVIDLLNAGIFGELFEESLEILGIRFVKGW
jgi:hypothetical protein